MNLKAIKQITRQYLKTILFQTLKVNFFIGWLLLKLFDILFFVIIEPFLRSERAKLRARLKRQATEDLLHTASKAKKAKDFLEAIKEMNAQKKRAADIVKLVND